MRAERQLSVAVQKTHEAGLRNGVVDRLFIISDAAALIADARLEGLLESRFPRFREIIVHRGRGSFRRALNCIKGSLAYRVVTKFKGANINADHARTWKRSEFAVGRIEAGNVKVTIVKLLVVRIAECAQRGSLVALERGDGAVEHRSRFISCPELFGASQVGGQYQRQCRKHRHQQSITHGILGVMDSVWYCTQTFIECHRALKTARAFLGDRCENITALSHTVARTNLTPPADGSASAVKRKRLAASASNPTQDEKKTRL